MLAIRLIVSIPMLAFIIFFTIWAFKENPLMLLINLILILAFLCIWFAGVRNFIGNKLIKE
jgi:hypothetical protein